MVIEIANQTAKTDCAQRRMVSIILLSAVVKQTLKRSRQGTDSYEARKPPGCERIPPL